MSATRDWKLVACLFLESNVQALAKVSRHGAITSKITA